MTYPGGLTAQNFKTPASVETISPYAFAGNKYLQSVNLNAVKLVQGGAFSGCENLSAVTGNAVEWCDADSFAGTSWLKNFSGAFVALGSVLIQYQGAAQALDLSEYATIAPFAFMGYQSLTEVTLGNNNHTVGSFAFMDCDNLSKINIRKVNGIVYIGELTFGQNVEGRKIYVPQTLVNQYSVHEMWAPYVDALNVFEATVHFDSGGQGDFPDATVAYDSYLDSLPTPEREHYDFGGWYDNAAFAGDAVTTATRWLPTQAEITLYAKWTPTDYLIGYRPGGGVFADEAPHYYTVEQDVSFKIPTQGGYTFAGCIMTRL